jgi:hypothetical protein
MWFRVGFAPIYDVETPSERVGLSLNMLKNTGFAEAPCVIHVETHVETLLRLLSSGFETLRKM